MEIGFIGLGKMGFPMARRLIEAKHQLVVYDARREAVDQLVRLQQAAARGPQKAPCFHVAFDIEKLSWELHYFEKHFLEGLRRCNLSVEDRSVLAETFHRLGEEIASWPRVLCHRDFHSRNLMRHRGSLYWIDFQDALLGPRAYDLVALLNDSYQSFDRPFQEARLDEFAARRGMNGAERRQLGREFDVLTMQRKLKDAGRFIFIDRVKKNPAFLPYFESSLVKVIGALSRLEDEEDMRWLDGMLRRTFE